MRMISYRRKLIFGLAQCITLLSIFLTLYGCNGTLYTHDVGGTKTTGVRAYPPATWLDEYATTIAVDKDGNIVGKATGAGTFKCDSIPVQKINTRADYSKPYFIFYEPGLLEKFEFEVELDWGVVKKVGTKGDPDRGQTFQNLAAGAKDIASIVSTGGVAGLTKVCNSGETFVKTHRLCSSDCYENKKEDKGKQGQAGQGADVYPEKQPMR